LTPSERHRVDLDVEAGRAGRLDAGQHLVEVAPAGDRAELVGSSVSIETLMRRTPSAQLCGVALELRAVGGEGQFVERAAREMAAEASRTGS
jgi:hypothetical protein